MKKSKLLFSVLLVGIIMSMFLMHACSSDDDDGGGDEPVTPEVVEVNTDVIMEYGEQIEDINETLEKFIVKIHTFETTNFTDLKSVDEAKRIFDEYVEAGEEFVEALDRKRQTQQSLKYVKVAVPSSRGWFDETVCFLSDFVDTGDYSLTVSPGLAKETGETVEKAKKEEKKNREKMENAIKSGSVSEDDAYIDYLIDCKNSQKKVIKEAANWGVANVMSTGAGLVAGAALGVAHAPVLVVVGGAYAAGKGVSWLVEWMSGEKTKSGEQKYFMTTGKTTVGGELPLHFIPEGANVSMKVDGYAPITIKNFKYPKDGMERTLDLHLAKESEIGKQQIGYCVMDKPMEAHSCEDIKFINATASPAHPAPGQSVTVTATLTPPIEGCEIYFHVIGTDGYENEETEISDAKGEAFFHIPGAAEDVFDKVTIRSCNGKEYIVSYTFN